MSILDTLKKKKPVASVKAKKATATTEAPTTQKAASGASKNKSAHAVSEMKLIVRPLVSEKAAMHEAKGVYTFVVERHATKISVARAIEGLYGIRPSGVRMLHMTGKWVRRGKQIGRRNEWKKAIVTLPKGKTIQVHSGV